MLSGQRIEPVLALSCGSAHHLLGHARLVLLGARRRVERALLRLVHATLDPRSLLVQDLAEPAVEVVEHAVEVRTLQRLLALRAEALHDPPQAGDVTAARAPQAALHEPMQRPTHVALGQDVVRERIEHVVCVERGQLLAAVPSRVAERAHRDLSLGR